MKEEKLIELIHKRATKALSDSENQQLESLLQNKDNQLLAEEIESIWESSWNYKKDYEPNVEAGLNKFKSKIQSEKSTQPKVVPIRRRSWLKVVAAAAVLLVGIGLGWNALNNNLDWQQVATTDTTEKLDLADGSVIWVSAKSELDFPSTFEKDQRVVRLDGQAFFDIAKNPEQPFIIETGDLQIKVLGTSFNIRNFANENLAQITVRSGKVEVSSTDGTFSKILEANDRLVFDKKRKTLRAVDKDNQLNDLAWWSGKISFQSEKVRRIKEVIERTYNVELEFSKSSILKCPYTITNDVKSEGLENLLETLKIGLALDDIKKISDKKYQLIGGKCNF